MSSLRVLLLTTLAMLAYDPKHPQHAVVLPGTDNGNRSRVGGWGLLLVSLGYAAATSFAG